MTDVLIGGAIVSGKALETSTCHLTEDERSKAEIELERREMAFRELFAGDPKGALMSLWGRVTALETAFAVLPCVGSGLS